MWFKTTENRRTGEAIKPTDVTDTLKCSTVKLLFPKQKTFPGWFV